MPSRPVNPPGRMASVRPFYDAEAIRGKLRRYDRTPFIDVLTTFLQCAPTPEAILNFSNKHPDRYAAALRALGHISGFAEKKEVQASLSGTVTVTDLSDSQLEDRLRTLARDMGIPLPPTIDLAPSAPIEDADVLPSPSPPSASQSIFAVDRQRQSNPSPDSEPTPSSASTHDSAPDPSS